jgi:hypothetical protein
MADMTERKESPAGPGVEEMFIELENMLSELANGYSSAHKDYDPNVLFMIQDLQSYALKMRLANLGKPSPAQAAPESPRAPTLTDSEVTVLNATRNALNETGLPWGKHYNYAMTLLEMLDGLHERTSAYANQDAAPVSLSTESESAKPMKGLLMKPLSKPSEFGKYPAIDETDPVIRTHNALCDAFDVFLQKANDRIAALEAEVERLKGQADE